MRSTLYALLSLLLAAPALGHASQRLIPAGSLLNCTIAEAKINSKTTAVGDPILCQMSHSERYGRSVLPYNSYLVGRFEEYKDPGHLVGKGWMELTFDRMVIQPDTVVPVDAKVVDVPGFNVDRQGRILGKGHAVRDTILWCIPILWPIDLLNLPRRGPRPTLKQETRLTIKVMDDLAVPVNDQPLPQRDPYGLSQRPPNAYNEPAPAPTQEAAPEPQVAQDEPVAPPDQDYAPAPPDQDYAPAPPVMAYAAPPVVVAPAPIYYSFDGYAAPAPPVYAGGGYAVAPRYAPRGYAAAPRYSVAPRYAMAPRYAPRGYAAAPRYGAPQTWGGGRGFAGGGRGFAGGFAGGARVAAHPMIRSFAGRR